KIIAVANSLISKNQNRIYKDLVPMRDTSEKDVICHMSPSPDKEAEYIAGEILDKHAKGMRFGDMTIMYRAHYVSRNLEEAFLKNDIPYTIYSGVQFFERREIKDSLAYLRMAAFRDDLSFRRIINVPKRNIGMRRMKILEEYAEKRNITLYEALKEISPSSEFSGTDAEEFIKIIDEASLEAGLLSVSDLLNNLLVKSGYENMLRTEGDQVRLDNISELKQSVFDYERTSGEESDLASYLRHISLFSNTDLIDVSDRVKLMTVHSAKGLEFPVVFLAGLNEGIFPSGKTRTLESMEEERRLCFVALTRAMDELYLTEAEGNNLNGSRRWPSRFILDIDEDRMVFSPKLDEQLVKNTLSYVKNSDLKMRSVASDDIMAPGTRIRHKVFGEGVIIEADTENMRYVIRFDSLTTPRGINMRVPLEKI
nr:ATP-binding domain-containing protein [Clostridia bacterium]